jgi:EpsI family protein
MNKRIPISVIVMAALMVVSVGVSQRLKPTERIANIKPKMVLKEMFPARFGQWQEQPAVQPLLPDPVGEAVIAATYSQTVARTYVNRKGEMVMLSVAYGDDQNSEATAAHRPEFCYTGNGFAISNLGPYTVKLPAQTLEVRHLLGVLESRHEYISYWVTLDESATLPGMGRKLAQLKYGLQGKIADGMLVRVSSISADPAEAYALQDRFLRELYEQVPELFRSRVFGT